jgi:hypothetical protein
VPARGPLRQRLTALTFPCAVLRHDLVLVPAPTESTASVELASVTEEATIAKFEALVNCAGRRESAPPRPTREASSCPQPRLRPRPRCSDATVEPVSKAGRDLGAPITGASDQLECARWHICVLLVPTRAWPSVLEPGGRLRGTGPSRRHDGLPESSLSGLLVKDVDAE